MTPRPWPDRSALASLLQTAAVWRGTETAGFKTRTSGHAGLDAALPGHGWPVGALIELVCVREGIGELSLALPALKSATDAGKTVVFVRPPYTPYSPALLRARLPLERLLWIVADCDADARWAAEQTLRTSAAGAVLLWSDTTDERHLRRLQLAAETGEALAFLYRAPSVMRTASPAALRIELRSLDQALRVDIVKARGGRHAVVDVPVRWSTAVVGAPQRSQAPRARGSSTSD